MSYAPGSGLYAMTSTTGPSGRRLAALTAALAALAALAGCQCDRDHRTDDPLRRDAAVADGAVADGAVADGAVADAPSAARDGESERADGGAGPAVAVDAGAPTAPAISLDAGRAARPETGPSPPGPAVEPGVVADGGPVPSPSGDGGVADGSAAAPPGGDDEAARRLAALVQAAYRDARGFEADFEQTYRNRLMGKTQKSSGHVWLRPPDRMRWEYAPPSKNLIVADGRHLFVYEPDASQVVRMAVGGSELPSVMAFLTAGRDLSEDYTLRSVHEEALTARGQAGLELHPRRPSSVVARVVLVVARDAGRVLRTVLVDPEGNTNTFVWANVRTDRDLPDSRFAFTPPAGARLVER